MVAGTIEKATGTRDLTELGGLAKAMPVTFAAAVAASVSMAGVPPSVGFIGKELLYTVGVAPGAAAWLPWAVLFAAAPIATVAMVLAIRPFFGLRPDYRKPVQEGHWALWCGPVVLGAVGIYWGLSPEFPFMSLLVPAATRVTGQPLPVDDAPWHSTGEALVLTLVTLAAAVLGFWKRAAAAEALAGLKRWVSAQRRPCVRRGHERHRRRRGLADASAAVRRAAALSADRIRHARTESRRDFLAQGRGTRAATVGGRNVARLVACRPGCPRRRS